MKNRLALVMIVRNEERCIARCLRSVKGVVDQIIVLDTGSTDDTVKIAKSMGARVHHFEWCDDFSAARNAALGHSSAQWNLILDADEWIGEVADKKILASVLASKKPFLGVLPISSDFDLQGQVEVSGSWIARILPRGVRYAGRIHEQPVSKLPQLRIELPILHDGYRQEALDRKKGRNASLLLRALEDVPTDPYLLYQLGTSHAIDGDYVNAVLRYTQALLFTKADHAFRHDLVVRTIFTLRSAKQHEAAIQFAESEMKNWEHSPDFFFALGDLLLDWGNQNEGRDFKELVPMIEASWLKCIEIGEQPALSGSVRGRGSFLAAHNLAVVYQMVGDTKQAEHYRKLATMR
jgi:glycosyltransferase involved in cell wall biosynthesis